MRYAHRILMRQLSMKRTRIKDVETSLAAGQCIHPDCNEPLDRRGCCQKHYGQFHEAISAKKDDAEKLAFEELMIREGLVLAPYEQRTKRTNNPFLNAEKAAS